MSFKPVCIYLMVLAELVRHNNLFLLLNKMFYGKVLVSIVLNKKKSSVNICFYFVNIWND